MSRKGGVLSGGFQPLKAPNAPTIDSVSAGSFVCECYCVCSG
jgi:hypothetical protein